MWWICISELISAVWRFSFEDRKPGSLRLVLKVWVCCDISCSMTQNIFNSVPLPCIFVDIASVVTVSSIINGVACPPCPTGASRNKPVAIPRVLFLQWSYDGTFLICSFMHLASVPLSGKCKEMLSHCHILNIQVWFLRFWWGKRRWRFWPTWRALWS